MGSPMGSPKGAGGRERGGSGGSGGGAGGDTLVVDQSVTVGAEFTAEEKNSLAKGNVRAAPLGRLRAAMATKPLGKTPLCDNLRNIRQDIECKAEGLRAEGKIAVVVIATDGKPTDGDLADVLKTFKHLPVSVIVRLCTDNDKVVDYWNDLDGTCVCVTSMQSSDAV